MKKTSFTIVSICLFVIASAAQNAETGFLKKIEGAWTGKGTAMGAASSVTMEWEPALRNQFYKKSHKMIMNFKGKEEVFEGMGLYKPLKEGGYEGTWFDSGGEMHPIKSSDDGKILTSYWGKQGEKYGKTEYEFIDEKTLEVRDAIQDKDGSWKQFAKNTLLRKSN